MPLVPDAAAIAAFHDRQLRERDWPIWSNSPSQTRPDADLWHSIDANHRYNGLLWREQARTRRAGASVDDVAAGKRLIDRYDDRRLAARDAIDTGLLALLAGASPRAGARMASETPGTMIDRLSQLCLQCRHVHEQAARADAGATTLQVWHARLERLGVQRADLVACLDALLREAREGQAYFKLYRHQNLFQDAC